MTFLFWNVDTNSIEDRVASIVKHYGVDVVLIAECAVPAIELIAPLQTAGSDWQEFGAGSAKVRLFSHLPKWSIEEASCDLNGSHAVFSVVTPTSRILLSVVHLTSKLNWDEFSQAGRAAEIAQDLARIEDEKGISDSLVVGDFNMHPFDAGMVMAQCFHAVASKSVANRTTRLVAGRAYKMMYNPMWASMGDQTLGPCGTLYFSSSKPLNYFWSTYDQVLLRPSLMNRLEDLAILDHDGTKSLLTKGGYPDRKRASDHLPILFKLSI